MLKADKFKLVDEVKEVLKETDGFVLADFKGLSVGELTDFRQKLRELGGYSRVVKNRLLKRAFSDSKIDGLEGYLKENTILIYAKGDIMKSLKVVADFAKENEKLKLKGGYVSGAVCDEKEVVAISKLPGQKELIAMIAGGMNAVVAKFAGTLNAIMTKFVGTVQAVEDKKKDQG